MNIALYAPLKPLGIGAPSGDSATFAGLVRFLRGRGHVAEQVSMLRARHIFQDKAMLRTVRDERRRALSKARDMRADLWLTFHSYWKAPDLLGPWCCAKLGVPYVMHKGMHAEKRRNDPATLPGFLVNRKALLQAAMVFTDDANDMPGLQFLPRDTAIHLPPGIETESFWPDHEGAAEFRARFGLKDAALVGSAAMFRTGVKTESLEFLIRALAGLPPHMGFHTVIAGDGTSRLELERLAERLLPGRCVFAGKLDKADMRALYSAADVFAFPGVGEGLGMVYLEAMCCGTPVVACAERGPRQLVPNDELGLLAERNDARGFGRAVETLLLDADMRRKLGMNARRHVLDRHDLNTNLETLEAAMRGLAEARSGRAAPMARPQLTVISSQNARTPCPCPHRIMWI